MSSPQNSLLARPGWHPAPLSPRLDDGSVHIHRVKVDAQPGHAHRMWPLLSPEERERASRFYAPLDRMRWILGRAELRIALGRYLAADPAGLVFEYGPAGKPALRATCNQRGLRFNVSHSGDWILFVVGTREVGVDVEQIRSDIDVVGLAQRWFSKNEYQALRMLPAAGQLEAFFSVWTRKEAYLKARGRGLSAGLDSIEVSVVPKSPAALQVDMNDPEAPSMWSLADLALDPSYKASLAIEGNGIAINYWDGCSHSNQSVLSTSATALADKCQFDEDGSKVWIPPLC